ncbi:MAG: DoxX family protein [Rhizobiales bacterium]|nr:DoxX family protein [Hyphomicrobiales bacterium]OJY41732.1 MAG: hypothetical protein BGP08_10160 [Rhizobiales bacterium 64-17]
MQDLSLPSTTPAMVWTGRIVSGLVALFLLVDGGIKLVPLDIVIETSRQMGIPEHLARTLGVLTLVGTLLYIFPRTAVLGAILLTGYFGGAIYAHVRIDSPLLSHTLFGVYLGILMWLGLWLRDARLRALLPFVRS